MGGGCHCDRAFVFFWQNRGVVLILAKIPEWPEKIKRADKRRYLIRSRTLYRVCPAR